MFARSKTKEEVWHHRVYSDSFNHVVTVWNHSSDDSGGSEYGHLQTTLSLQFLPVTRTALSSTERHRVCVLRRRRPSKTLGEIQRSTTLEGHKICVVERRYHTSSVRQRSERSNAHQHRKTNKMRSPRSETKPSVHDAGTKSLRPPTPTAQRPAFHDARRRAATTRCILADWSSCSSFVSFTSCPDTRVCLALHKTHFAQCFVDGFDPFFCRDHQTVSRFAKSYK